MAGVHVEGGRVRDFERVFRNAERVLDAILAEVHSLRQESGDRRRRQA